MEMFGKNVPDDLNEWSKETFKEVGEMFKKAMSNFRCEIESQKNNNQSIMNNRPQRENVIQEDDITNLKIALNSVQTIDELLENM